MSRGRWLISLAPVLLVLSTASCTTTQHLVTVPPTSTDPQVSQSFLSWIITQSDSGTGLPVSHVGDERFTGWCSTYDAAVTAIAYIASGDLPRAQRILDYYRTHPSVWRLGWIVGAVSATRADRVKDYKVWTGENMWMGIAAMHFYHATQRTEYLAFAKRLADRGLVLQHMDTTALNYGGIPLGPAGDGYSAGDQHLNYDPKAPTFDTVYATEHNIDAYVLLRMLYTATGQPKYEMAYERILIWLTRVAYNTGAQRLNRGSHTVVDTAVATDVHAWAISGLGPEVLDRIAPGLAARLMTFIEQACLVEIQYTTPIGQELSVLGADFVDHATVMALGRAPMISPEWTLQVVNAYQQLGTHHDCHGDHCAEHLYARQREHLLESVLQLACEHDGGLALPYATLPNAPIDHHHDTPAEGTLSTIGTAYAILSLLAYDPLVLPDRSWQDRR